MFDFDGVIADSTQANLDYLVERGKTLGIEVMVPTKEKLRNNRVSSNLLKNLFMNAGFREEDIDQVYTHYYDNFSKTCKVHPFPGMLELVNKLRKNGCRTALISSNYKATITDFLKEDLKVFDLFYAYEDPGDKTVKMRQACQSFGISPIEAIYVGDTLSDYESAKRAGVHFIGVSYGWEIMPKDKGIFEVANSVSELDRKISYLLKTKKQGR